MRMSRRSRGVFVLARQKASARVVKVRKVALRGVFF